MQVSGPATMPNFLIRACMAATFAFTSARPRSQPDGCTGSGCAGGAISSARDSRHNDADKGKEGANKTFEHGMSSDHYLHWSVGPPKRFKPGGVKPEANWWINLGSSEMAKEHDDACTIADHFDCVACPFGSRTRYRNSMSSGHVGRRRKRRCCRAEIRRRDSGMSVMRASSSSETGPDTTQHKSASAPDSPHLIAHRVTWSCLPAWNLQNKPRNCHQIRK